VAQQAAFGDDATMTMAGDQPDGAGPAAPARKMVVWLVVAALGCLGPHVAIVALSREAFPFTSSPMFALSPGDFTKKTIRFSFIDREGDAFTPPNQQEELMTRVRARDLRRAFLRQAWRADQPSLTWPWPASVTGGPYGHRHDDTREARRDRVERFWAGIVARERARQASVIKRRDIVAIALDAVKDRKNVTRLGTYIIDDGRFVFGDEPAPVFMNTSATPVTP